MYLFVLSLLNLLHRTNQGKIFWCRELSNKGLKIKFGKPKYAYL